jgi:PAS domain S-box-containing protein
MKVNYAQVLLLDRDKAESRELRHFLSRETPGFRCQIDIVDTTNSAMSRLRKRRFDDVIVKLSTNNGDDLGTVREIHSSNPDVPILVLTDSADVNMRTAALRHGASDYFVKGADSCEGILRRIRHLFQEKVIFKNLVDDYCYRRALLQDAPNPVVCISPEGIIVEFNSEAELLWGLSRSDAVGRSFVEMFVSDSDRDALKRCFTRTLAGHLTKNQKATVAPEDEEQCSVLWDISRTTDARGNTVAVIAVGHDKVAVGEVTNESGADRYEQYNPNFEDTAYMVLAGLSAIIEKIERIEEADPAVLERLDEGLIVSGDEAEGLSLEQVSAVERLVLSLLNGRLETV